MSRRSISRSARAGYIAVSKAASLLTDMTNRWARGGTTIGEETTLFKEGVDKINKALDVMSDNLELKMLLQLWEESKHSALAVVPKTEIPEGTTPVNIAVLDLLLAKALYWCDPCDVTDYTACGLRAAFESAGLAPYDNEVTDRCVYCYKVKPGKKPIATRNEFTEYCQKHYDITPQKDLLEAFDDLIAFNTIYYEKTGVTEKILRKFMEFHRGRTL